MDSATQKRLKEFSGLKPATALMTNILDQSQKKLFEKTLPAQPWSDTYWPDTDGSIGRAYTSYSYASQQSAFWQKLAQIGNDLRSGGAPSSMDPKELEKLSPAEKYDLLLGDYDMTFSKAVGTMLKDMDRVWAARGQRVEGWEGVCHGWSPASLYEERPAKKIVVKNRYGQAIPFFPTDIKGLLSFGWGKSASQNSAIVEGRQCWDRNRIMDPRLELSGSTVMRAREGGDCGAYDVQAMFVHQALIQNIGIKGRGFIADMHHHGSVWNHPIYGYKMEFYNFKQNRFVDQKVDQAIVDKKYILPELLHIVNASPEVQSVVGVRVTVMYGVEGSPSHDEFDTNNDDSVAHKKWEYILELDKNNHIIGSEWSTRELLSFTERSEHEPYGFNYWKRPDILWIMPEGTKPWADIEWMPENHYIDFDLAKDGVPESVMRVAQRAAVDRRWDSVTNPQVLYSVSSRLRDLSNSSAE